MSNSITSIIRKQWPLFFSFFGVSGFFTPPLYADGPNNVTIKGWPTPQLNGDHPEFDLGDDPVVGRQICPPLTRLNLKEKGPEPLVVRRVVDESSDKGEKKWRMELRSGIYWWSGDEVNAAQIAETLKKNLAAYIQFQYAGVITAPDFEVKAADALNVIIEWKKAPPFGPYVFNGLPLFRDKQAEGTATKFECVGNFRPTSLDPLILEPSPGYSFARRLPKLTFLASGKSAEAADVEFLFVDDPGASDLKRCAAVWSSPYFSVIAWNLDAGLTQQKEFRRLMTGLVPRQQMVSSGVLAYSDTPSAPIPRNHPGYNSKEDSIPFDAVKVSASLDKMGFRRKKASAMRSDLKGNPIKLTIYNRAHEEGLIEKLISDSFASVGLELDFEPAGDQAPKHADGHLYTLRTDFPQVDFLTMLHAKAPASSEAWRIKDAKFEKQLEAYSVSLTSEAPDFKILSNIHKYLADEQIFTVVAHHRACIKTSNVLRVKAADVDNGDPDWFRDIFF